MKDFLQFYVNPFEKDINIPLMNKSHDRDLVDFVVETAASLEMLKNIKFDGYEFEEREHKIDSNDIMRTRKKNRNKQDVNYIMDINETRCGELRLFFTLTCDELIKNRRETVTQKITKKILIPLQDENGYFTISGTKYMLLYQLLEASTYISKNNVILKSLQGITLIRNSTKIKDSIGNSHSCPIFNLKIFNKEIMVILLYLAKFGFINTISFFGMRDVFKVMILDINKLEEDEKKAVIEHEDDLIVNDDMDHSKFYYFPVNKKIYFRVKKKFFDKYDHVKSVVSMMLSATTNRLRVDELYDNMYWLEKLNKKNNETSISKKGPDRGKSILLHLDRMLDETNIKNLKVSMFHKKTVYHIMRWLMLEYDELKKKDNMDLNNKRLRCPEYIASLLTKHWSDKLNRVINLGQKAKMSDITQIFKFQIDILIKQLYASGILPFDDRTSDMDFFNKFKYTTKGPNSVGNKNDNNVSKIYRGIHPSFIGRIDINVCGNSDPGRTGIITPFCKTYGLYFNGDYEPQLEFDRFLKDVSSDNDEKVTVVVIGKGGDEESLVTAYDSMANSFSRLKYNYNKEDKITHKDDYMDLV